jgi:hypothetical protein
MRFCGTKGQDSIGHLENEIHFQLGGGISDWGLLLKILNTEDAGAHRVMPDEAYLDTNLSVGSAIGACFLKS